MPPSASITERHSATICAGCAPASAASAPRRSARERARARMRSSSLKYWLRLDRATPSSARTIGTGWTRTGMSSWEKTVRRTASCWASFCPYRATSGRTRLTTLVHTSATPAKCVGRVLPSRTRAMGPGSIVTVAGVGVHVLGRGCPHEVCPHRLERVHVRVQGARIGVEVLAGRELRRVDEDRDDHVIGQFAGFRARAAGARSGGHPWSSRGPSCRAGATGRRPTRRACG